MNKKKLILIITSLIIATTIVGCSSKPKEYTMRFSDGGSAPVEENLDNEEEPFNEINEKEESNLIFLEETGQYSKISIYKNEEEIMDAPALGGVMEWMHLREANSVKNLSYLIAEEKDGDIRTYKYAKYSPNYDPELDNGTKEEISAYLERNTAKGVASNTIFRYSISQKSIELLHENADVTCKNINESDYIISVNGVDAYKLSRYYTGDTYTGAKGEINRPMAGFKIETLEKDSIVEEIDAITTALILLNNIYVKY